MSSEKEKWELKKQERERKQKRFQQVGKIKKISKISLGVLTSAVMLGGFVWLIDRQPPIQESDIISRQGIHWHPHLRIVINGKEQEIPANIGIGIVHAPIHTHDDTGTLHLEFSGLVKKDDIKLGQFFKIWGKPFPSFNVKMLVNGKENTEFENYLMQDKDEIEIIF